MISDSLKYPFTNINRALGLILLLLGSILIIPAVCAIGYILRIIENTSHGSNELPPFEEWGDMIMAGLKYIAATIIYLVIPYILMFTVFPGVITSYSGGFSIEKFLLSTIIGLVIFLPFRLVYIIALGNMAYERRFKAAFQFRKLKRFIEEIGWLKYFAYVLVFDLIGELFGLISTVAIYLEVPLGLTGLVIGAIVSVLISSYVSLYGARFIGLIYLKGQRSVKNDHEIESSTGIKEKQDIETV